LARRDVDQAIAVAPGQVAQGQHGLARQPRGVRLDPQQQAVASGHRVPGIGAPASHAKAAHAPSSARMALRRGPQPGGMERRKPRLHRRQRRRVFPRQERAHV
jgi:hypothetical protein